MNIQAKELSGRRNTMFSGLMALNGVLGAVIPRVQLEEKAEYTDR